MLQVSSLSAKYATSSGYVQALSRVDLTVGESEILGIAGESGSGKSSLLKVMYGAVEPPLTVSSGEYRLDLKDGTAILVNKDSRASFRDLWWRYLSYVPQGAMNVLNPVARVESQFMDTIARISVDSKQVVRERIVEYLDQLDLDREVLRYYPHQLSGGMRQRVVIAMATLMQPEVILADEPTTALDVVVQRGILTLLVRLQRQMQNSLVVVSHDMGVHYQIADRIAIMFSGRVVECGDRSEVFSNSKHPYTKALINSLPVVGDRAPRRGISETGQPVKAAHTGCPFVSRCPSAMEKCNDLEPRIEEVAPGHVVSCHLYD